MEQMSKITSVIAHIDHGKTTLIDSLIAADGYFSKSLAGEIRYLDSRKDEQERGITLKLTPIKLKNGHAFVDTPGHVDFEHLIFSSSILSDNHLVLIDVNEGITPRTNSLVKFINKSRSILVLNKVDRCTDFDSVSLVLHQVNGLLGEEVFEWSKNNVILGSAILGAGICHGTFKFSKKNTLATAFKAFRVLDGKIINKDTESIIARYRIKCPNRKSIFNSVMPLSDAVFRAIDFLYENASAGSSSRCHKPSGDGQFSLESDFYSIYSARIPKVLGITTYGLLKTKNQYIRDNIMFVTRIISGKISKGDMLHCVSNGSSRKVSVKHVYDFSIDTFKDIECMEGPALVYLQGDFMRSSVLSSEPVTFSLRDFLSPFFRSKVVLRDLLQLEAIKEAIRAVSFVEQNLKVRLNKYGELEFKCGGSVQFEKICFDLAQSGYNFYVREPGKDFREFPKALKRDRYCDELVDIEIIVGPIKDFNRENELLIEHFGLNFYENALFCTEKNNAYVIQSAENSHIIESVLDTFTDSGPQIKEKIINAFICIKSNKENSQNFFSTFKTELTRVYLQSEPSICPLFFFLKLSLSKDYLGPIYATLQKHFYVMESEDYCENTGFTVLNCMIPQFAFNDLTDEIRVKSKGTAYLEVYGGRYICEGGFDSMINEMRKEKGLHIKEKIVENPEKQRTVRKQF